MAEPAITFYTKTIKGLKPILIATLLLLIFVALMLGRYQVYPQQMVALIISRITGAPLTIPSTIATVVFDIRLPRILGAVLIGAALSVSGTAYQGIFRNPLVSPDILGASAGAGFGAALAIVNSWGMVGIQLSAFFFGMLAVLVTYIISTRIRKNDSALILALGGILVGTLFSSLVSLIKYIADPFNKLPAITYWLMGSLASLDFGDMKFVLLPMLVGLIPLYLIRWRLNVLSFGDEEAEAMGVNTHRLRGLVICSATLLTASAVSISGIIGWVGLVIPHLARAIVGPDYKILLPVSLLIGSSFLLLVDTLARTLISVEVPLGILTSLIGAPFFLYMLANGRRGWQ